MLSLFKSRDSLSLLVLLAVAALLFFTGLGSRALWDIDEGMHSAMAKEMVRTGDWVTPTLNGEPFLDKPALVNWLGGASIAALGRTEFAARFPGALLGLLCVLLTFFLGRRMFDTRTAFLAGIVLATSLLFLLLTRAVVYDVILTFFTTLSIYAFYCAQGETERRQRRSFLILFYAAIALAVLTKGPLGVVLPGLVVGPYILVTRQWALIRKLELHWGALMVTAIVLPWYVLMGQRNPEFLSHFFVGQNVGYFASQGSRHPQPVYYYVLVILVGLFPWSTLLLQALARAWRDFRRHRSRELLFLLLWSGVIFAFFTAAVSKLPPYVLPILPALALLVGRLWAQQLDETTNGPGRTMAWALVPLAAVLSGALIYGFVRPPVELTEKYGIAVSLVYVVFAIMATLALAALAFLWWRRYAASFAALATVSTALVLFFVIFVAPSVDSYRSTKGLSATMDQLLPPGQSLCFYKTLKDSTLFYTDRLAVVLETPDELQEYLEAGPQALCVVETKKLPRLGGLADRFLVEAREGNKLLVRIRPPVY